MDVLGKLRELVQIVFQADNQDVILQPNSTTTYTAPTTVNLPNDNSASQEITGNDATQTLTNKTLSDTTTKIANAGDLTKTLDFDLSGAATSTETSIIASQTVARSLTLPDADDTLVGKATTDTLTNKTLDDATTLVADTGDATKTLGFELGGATASTKTTIASSQTVGRTLTLPDADDTLVGKATPDTLTNKSLDDATTNFVDEGDATKRLNVALEGATASTRTTIAASQTVDRTLTLPDATDTLVGKDTTDVMTNKSLEADTSQFVDTTDNTKVLDIDLSGSTAGTETTIIASQTVDRALTLPDADDTLVGKATTDTLTNKSFDDATTLVVDTVDATKSLGFELGGAATGTKTTVTASQTISRAVTLPDADDTLVGKATPDTLTNKTLTDPVMDASSVYNHITTPATPAASTNKIFFKADGIPYVLDENGIELPFALGASSILVNWVRNFNAETDVTTHTTTSGSLTMSAETVNQLVGAQSFKLTANGATGGTCDWTTFPIDHFYEGREVQLEVLYTNNASSGDFQIGVHDGASFVSAVSTTAGTNKTNLTFISGIGQTYTVRLLDVSASNTDTIVIDQLNFAPPTEANTVNGAKSVDYSESILVSSMAPSSAHVITHNTNIDPNLQRWTGTVQLTGGGAITPLGEFVTAMDANSVTIDVQDQLGTSTVTVKLENLGFLGAASQARYFDSGEVTATALDALFPITHNLVGVPTALELWQEAAGFWTQIDHPGGVTKVDETTIDAGAATVASLVGGATNVRLITGTGQSALSVIPASATESGVVTTGTQTMAGAKTFTDVVSFTTGITGPGTVPLGAIVAIASNLTGAHTIPGTGTVDADGFQYCDGSAIAGSATMSGTIYNLTDSRFLMGSTSAGATGGATNTTLATTNLPSHSHDMQNHTHSVPAHTHTASSISGSTGGGSNHSHGISNLEPLYNQFAAGGGGPQKGTNAGGNGISASINGESGHTHSVGGTAAGQGGGATTTAGPNNNTTTSTGSGTAFDNRPLYLSVQYVMRVK